MKSQCKLRASHGQWQGTAIIIITIINNTNNNNNNDVLLIIYVFFVIISNAYPMITHKKRIYSAY